MALIEWGTATKGGYMYADELSDVLRMEVESTTRFRNLCDAMDFSDKGLHRGDLATWNVYSKITTSGTTLDEGTAIPEADYTVTPSTATVVEWGNSIPFTSLVDDMASQSVTAVTKKVLARDCRETLDTEAHSKFDDTPLIYVATGTGAGTLYTNGTATGVGSPLNVVKHKDIVDTMKERNIPGYSGDDYIAIAHPTTLSNIRTELESVQQYTETGYGLIQNGEIGRYYGVRFVEQTHIAKENWGTADAGSNWVYYMGEDTVGEVISRAPEVRGKIPTDYGRSHGIAWYALEGFGLVHSDATNARIVKYGSVTS